MFHLGCGPIHLPGWVNIDKEGKHSPDIQVDYLRLREHFDASSVDLIFACHTIEHLTWPCDVEHFFGVTWGLLKAGGTIRLVVPDLMKVAKLYVDGDDLRGIYSEGEFYTGHDTPATRFMYFCRSWEHTVLFDERLLRMLMVDAGFVNVRVMPFGESDIPELRDIDRMPAESISMEATKP